MTNASDPIRLLYSLRKKYLENTINFSDINAQICTDFVLLSKANSCIFICSGINNQEKKVVAFKGNISQNESGILLDKLQNSDLEKFAFNSLTSIDSIINEGTKQSEGCYYLLKITNHRPHAYVLFVFEKSVSVPSELIELFSTVVASGYPYMKQDSTSSLKEKISNYSANLSFFVNNDGVLLYFSGKDSDVEKEIFPDNLFIGDNFTEKINSIYKSNFEKWIAETFQGKKVENEQELETNSNACFLKISCLPQYEEEKITGVILVIKNITYTHELERSLNEITQITNSVNQSAIVSITDSNGAITYVNTRFELVSGYSLPELLGRTHNVVESAMHDRVFWKEFWLHISNGNVWRGVIINKRKNDDLYWVDSTISPMFDHTGEIESYISIGFEVTENEMIKKELDKKEIMISETHHRIKNNLQIVRSLLSLQRKKYDNKELQKTILDSENRIMAMAMVHESIYHNHNADKLSLKHYLHSFIGELANSYLSADTIIELKIEDGFLESSALISLGIIINELVSNTSKYAFGVNTKERRVRLLGEKFDTYYRLKYSDNGTGLPEGLDYKTLKSLGINLIMGLGKQMKAKPIIWNDNGFNFEITIPYKNTKIN